MSYLVARRFGLTRIDPSPTQRQSGWRQVWQHPSGMLAMRHPVSGRWMVSDGYFMESGFCSSLRAAANKINRLTTSGSAAPEVGG